MKENILFNFVLTKRYNKINKNKINKNKINKNKINKNKINKNKINKNKINKNKKRYCLSKTINSLLFFLN
jgi:hypothetical protein